MRRALVITILALLAAPQAWAYVAPGATVVSASLDRRELADDATSAAVLSGDGRFVAIATAARNLFGDDVADPPGQYYSGGLFRRDVAGGGLELVALGDLRAEADGAFVRSGAANPSISRDGRYVAFSTGERLVPADTNANIDVYVRDMARPRGPAAYTLVSALDGSDAPAGYGGDTAGAGASGADVATGIALSGDGDHVVFRTAERTSDLAGADTPPFQVFVRDIATRRTRLITHERGTRVPAGGAIGGAGISRDGSTVVWTGANVNAQVRLVRGEQPDSTAPFYLWQRIADGDTRRVTGSIDPDDPGCTDVAQAACNGPLDLPEGGLGGIGALVPALSADGDRVLFLTSSPPHGSTQGITLDLFETVMSAGVTRRAGTVELTREGTSRDPVASSPIESATLSADGRFAALVTQRTRFLPPTPPLTSSVRATPGFSELYLIDLAAATTERVVRGTGGGDGDGNVIGTPSLSDDGTRVAYLSAASNLFFGDANGRTDAFVSDWLPVAPPEPEQAEPPADPVESLPLPPEPEPVKRLPVSVRSAAVREVRLEVRAPAAGVLTVRVRGRIPDSDGRPRGSAKLLGSARKTVKKAGKVTLTVRLLKRYRPALERAGTIAAQAVVELTPKTGRPSSRTVSVRFREKRS